MTTKDLVDATRGIVDLADENASLKREVADLNKRLTLLSECHKRACDQEDKLADDYAKLMKTWEDVVNERDALKARVNELTSRHHPTEEVS